MDPKVKTEGREAADYLIELIGESNPQRGIKKDEAIEQLRKRGFYRGWEDTPERMAMRWATIVHSASAEYRGLKRVVICGDHVLFAENVEKTQASRKKKDRVVPQHLEYKFTLHLNRDTVTVNDATGSIVFDNVVEVVITRQALPVK